MPGISGARPARAFTITASRAERPVNGAMRLMAYLVVGEKASRSRQAAMGKQQPGHQQARLAALLPRLARSTQRHP
jgi:hypothetical protein